MWRMVLIMAHKGTLPRLHTEECVLACRLLECLGVAPPLLLIDHFLPHALHLCASLPAAKWQSLPGLRLLFIMLPDVTGYCRFNRCV